MAGVLRVGEVMHAQERLLQQQVFVKHTLKMPGERNCFIDVKNPQKCKKNDNVFLLFSFKV